MSSSSSKSDVIEAGRASASQIDGNFRKSPSVMWKLSPTKSIVDIYGALDPTFLLLKNLREIPRVSVGGRWSDKFTEEATPK